jgi:hypothetical protein
MTSPLERLHERARAQRSRILVRQWEARQLKGSKGTWYRLRVALTFAEAAYAVDAATLTELLAEGWKRAPVGDELEPAKDYVFVSRERASKIASARPMEIRLSAALLAEPHVVLVPFEGITPL